MQIFKGKRVGRLNAKEFLGFDVETDSDGNFICAALYGVGKKRYGKKMWKAKNADTIQEYFEDEASLHSFIEELALQGYKFTLVSHNASFDMKYLLPIMKTDKSLFSGSRLIRGELDCGFELVDSMSFFPGRLEDLIILFELPEKYGIIKRAGYLDSVDGKKQQVLDDAKAVYYVMVETQNFFITEFGVVPRLTMPATALAVFQTQYFDDVWSRGKAEQWKNDYEREAYFGGRTEIFEFGEHAVKSYDVNGMYVNILAEEYFPNPDKSIYIREEDEIEEAFNRGEFMIIDVSVDVPKMKVAPLPYREETTGKLIFPYGRFRGKYVSLELSRAVESGVKILEFHSALLYPEKKQYFSEYAKMTQRGRAKAKEEGNEIFNQLYKLMGNSLYGKFGQRNQDGGRYINEKDAKDLETIEGFTLIEVAGETYFIEPPGDLSDSLHTFPCIPAFVTAYGRIQLFNALTSNEEAVIYCDTDSIKIHAESEFCGIVGKEPGQFDFEYERVEEFRGIKNYGGRIKGVRKTAEQIELTDTLMRFRQSRAITFKESIRRNLPQNKFIEEIKEIKRYFDDKRVWLSLTESLPLYIDGI